MKNYYLYAHIRPDKNEVFYIGIGSCTKGYYDRANNKNCKKHNNIWCKIFNKNQGKIIVTILANFDNLKDCRKAEIWYIKNIGKICENTGSLANIADGGEYCVKNGKIVAQYELDGTFIQHHKKLTEIPYCFKAISQAIINNGSSNGYQWRYADSSDNIGIYIDPRKHIVYQLTRDNKFICKFNSIGEAHKITKIDRASINNTLLGKRKTAGNFKWSYTNPDWAKEQGFSLNRL